jgi:hypothetical protein
MQGRYWGETSAAADLSPTCRAGTGRLALSGTLRPYRLAGAPGSMLFSRSRTALPECLTYANMDSETELLVARSPIGDNIIGDASLLDYDSNNTAL